MDPGETTGYAIFREGKILFFGEFDSLDIGRGCREIEALLDKLVDPTIVYETYRVYSWKAKEHTHSDLHTPQFIGAIKALASARDIPIYTQSAQLAKGFATDEKLKFWDMWAKGKKHARDAIRHAIYFTLFTYPKICNED